MYCCLIYIQVYKTENVVVSSTLTAYNKILFSLSSLGYNMLLLRRKNTAQA